MMMKERKSKRPDNATSHVAATKESRVRGDKSFLKLTLPPAEIADDAEVRMGCSVISGQFPAFRKV
jgi:hypothetical protein